MASRFRPTLNHAHLMNSRTHFHLSVALTCAFLLNLDAKAGDWPRYRGPNGFGVSPDEAPVPTKWTNTENLKWRVEIPGPGHSSPIVVGDRVFLTYWSGYGTDAESPGDMNALRLNLLCLNRGDGSTLWSKTVEPALPEQEYGGMMLQHGYATHTPASDGEKVFAFFGKSGVAAFDMEGKPLWRASVGDELDRRGWGSASSPILYKGLVIVTASVEDQAIVALDKESGKEVWREKADGFSGTWGTPVLVDSGGRSELILSVPNEVWALNPENGRLRWFCDGAADNTACSSAIVEGDIVYVIGGRQGGTTAVRAGGRDDVNQSHVLWTNSRSGRTASPILHEGRLYWIHEGFANCIDAKTGREIYRERLARSNDEGDSGGGRRGRFGGFDYASPVATREHLYQVKRNGEVIVAKLGREYEEVARNRFEGDDSEFTATPAISKGDLFIRSAKYLYCVGN